MKYKVVLGSNCKNYVQVYDAEKGEEEIYDMIEKIVSRSEFKPFVKSSNKMIHQSYWINHHFFPATFIDDVESKLNRVLPKPIFIEGCELLQFPITREEFDEYVYSLKLPDKYKLDDERYIYQPDSAYLAIREKIAHVDIATGGGKTMLTYLYCKTMKNVVLPKLNTKAFQILIVVPRKDLCKQLKANFEEYDSLQKNKLVVETIYSGSRRIVDADVVVGTFQSLSEYETEYFDNFISFICDEVHTGKSYSIRNGIFSKMLNVEFALGMTGTFPKYNTLDYLNIVAMFGKCVVKKETKELQQDGIVCPVKIHCIKINYSGDDANFSERLKEDGIIGSEKYRLEKTWFQDNDKRTMLIAKLINNFQYNNLILVDTVNYCDRLKEFLSIHCPDKYVTIIYGNTSDDERDEIKREMEERDDMVLIATYGTMSTGISINNIMNLYFPDGGKSEIRVKQSLGRGLRLHPKKEFLNVFDFQDNMKGSASWNQALARNRIYREEKHVYKITEVTI